jgi:threonine dehydratase
MALSIGDNIPDIELFVMGAEGPQKVSTGELLGTGKVVLFAVPGAFTPGCSRVHLPGFVQQAQDVTDKGVDRIVTVNDDEIAEAVRLYFRCCHTVAEGAGAAPLAALMQERDRMKGRRVGVILSGGNIDMPKFAEVLEGKTPAA